MAREQLQLHHLKPAAGSKKEPIRVGRGEGGRKGKTAGRGTKGLKARNSLRPGFEGGQTNLAMRTRKLKGFKNPNQVVYTVVNVGSLGEFPANSTVTVADLRKKGLVKKHGPVKVLGSGDVDRVLKVQAQAFSETARKKIEDAGGSAEVLGD